MACDSTTSKTSWPGCDAGLVDDALGAGQADLRPVDRGRVEVDEQVVVPEPGHGAGDRGLAADPVQPVQPAGLLGDEEQVAARRPRGRRPRRAAAPRGRRRTGRPATRSAGRPTRTRPRPGRRPRRSPRGGPVPRRGVGAVSSRAVRAAPSARRVGDHPERLGLGGGELAGQHAGRAGRAGGRRGRRGCRAAAGEE